jgi:outer membrane protein assembly factor BamB
VALALRRRFWRTRRMKLPLIALLLASTMALAQDWPRYRGPQGDGSWNPPTLPADLQQMQPRQLWTASVGGGYGGVTVSAGRVYLMDRQKAPLEVERILCFDATDGRLVWKHEYPVRYGSMEYGSGPRASVTLDAGLAYAFGATGIVTCLDARSGEVRWHRDTVKELGAIIPTWGFAASPYLWKETVLIHCGAQPNGSVVAFKKSTGEVAWRGGSDPAGYCTPVVFEMPGGPQLIQWGPKHVMSLEPDTGRELWRFPYEITYGVSIAQPLYHEGLLLVSGYWHGARAIKPGPPEPALAWSEEKVLCGLMSSPLYRDGHVYLLTKDDGVVCFKLSDGSIRWKDGHRLTPASRSPQLSLVWAKRDDGIAAGLNSNGELIFARFTPEKMDELARHQIIGKTWAHPAFAGRKVFARSDTELVCWELWGGE